MSPLRSMVNVYVFYASGFVEWSVFALIAHNYYYICPKIFQSPRFNVYVCLAMFAFICAPFCSNWFNAFHLTNCSRSRSLIQRRSKNEPFKHNSYPRPLTKKRNNQERTEQKKNENGFQIVLSDSVLRYVGVRKHIPFSFRFMLRQSQRKRSGFPTHQTLIRRGI